MGTAAKRCFGKMFPGQASQIFENFDLSEIGSALVISSSGLQCRTNRNGGDFPNPKGIKTVGPLISKNIFRGFLPQKIGTGKKLQWFLWFCFGSEHQSENWRGEKLMFGNSSSSRLYNLDLCIVRSNSIKAEVANLTYPSRTSSKSADLLEGINRFLRKATSLFKAAMNEAWSPAFAKMYQQNRIAIS